MVFTMRLSLIYFIVASLSPSIFAESPPLLLPSSFNPHHATSNLGILVRQQNDNNTISSPIEPRTFDAGVGKSWGNLRDFKLNGVLTLWGGQTQPSGNAGNEIRFLSCDSQTQGANTTELFLNATKDKPMAILLYSTAQDMCKFNSNDDDEEMFDAVYSMTSAALSRQFEDTLKQPQNNMMQAIIAYNKTQEDLTSQNSRHDGDDDNNGPNQNQQQSVLGPAPTTAVAMIILYSITGIVTFLFLAVITIGAFRAHRHPERYGPRPGDTFGRSRQTRALGIARAVLDTIPLVKFRANQEEDGTEEPKNRDVEMEGPSTTIAASTATTTAGASAVGNDSKENTAENGDNSGVSKDGTHESRIGTASTIESQQTEGASVDAISTAHRRSVSNSTAEDAVKSSKRNSLPAMNPSHLICPICMDSFVEGQQLRVLPCRHPFHPECVDPWLLNVAGSCPLCRVDLHQSMSENKDVNTSQPAAAAAVPPLPATPSAEHRHHHGPLAIDRSNAGLRSSRFVRYREILRGSSSAGDRETALRQLQETREQRRRSHGGSESNVEAIDNQTGNETEPVTQNRLSLFSRRRPMSWSLASPRTLNVPNNNTSNPPRTPNVPNTPSTPHNPNNTDTSSNSSNTQRE